MTERDGLLRLYDGVGAEIPTEKGLNTCGIDPPPWVGYRQGGFEAPMVAAVEENPSDGNLRVLIQESKVVESGSLGKTKPKPNPNSR